MKECLILLKRELKSITREKTIMFAIMIQFFIASFSSIILVGIMAFYDPASISDNTRANIKMGLVESPPGGPMTAMLNHKGIAVRNFGDQNSAEQAFLSGDIDAVMVIPVASGGVVDMKLVLPQLDAKQTVILMALQVPLKDYENVLRSQDGVQLSYPPMPQSKSSNTFEFLYSIVIPILMLFPALIAGSILIDSVAEEFENKTFDTLMVAPVSLKQVFASKILAAVITAVVQLVLWTLLLRINGITIQSPWLVVAVAICVATIISLVAAVIALYFKDRERAQFVYSIVLIFLVGSSYFLGISPISIISRLAAGAHSFESLNLLLYLTVVAFLALVFLKVSRKLVFAHR